MSDARPPILEVRGLRKSFGTSEVLCGIDFRVMPQELVFVAASTASRSRARAR